MLKVIKMMLVLSVSFLFESFSMTQEFDNVIIGNAADKRSLFNGLQGITNGEDKVLSDKYIALYSDNAPEGGERKKILMTANPLERKKITGAAAYVVKSLFNKSKKDIYSVSTLDECIRMASLLLMDAPELANSNPMNNIEIILKAAQAMRDERAKFQADIKMLYASHISGMEVAPLE